jgi:hypothetical protein
LYGELRSRTIPGPVQSHYQAITKQAHVGPIGEIGDVFEADGGINRASRQSDHQDNRHGKAARNIMNCWSKTYQPLSISHLSIPA